MLKIWYYADIDYMKDAPSYFNNVYEDEWIEDAFVKEMIRAVDHCTVISSRVIESSVLGTITPCELSGGVKILILMLKDDSFIYNMSSCGDNCAKWILRIAEKKDLTVYLRHIMRFEGTFKIQIMNTQKIVCNLKEYVEGLLEAEELEMEGARISWDELTCVGYPVTDEATEKLCQDIQNFRKKAGMVEHLIKKEQLINWKILKQSEGQLLATNAYALLTSDYFPFSKTQCAVFKGTDRAVFLDKREFTGPIYNQIEEAVDFILRNIRLGATIDRLVRKEKYELPPEAIREMIINAHCHRNLLEESCIQVAIYDDRLEVTSPGGLYNGLTYEEVMNGHSKLRNKGIANIFSQMGLVEAWGSGIKGIFNATEEYGLPKPRFQEFDNMFRVELFRKNTWFSCTTWFS